MPALLSTKFFPPAPHHNWVARPGILETLNAGLKLGRPVTLVSAPAGYGKSVAVAEWLSTVAGGRAAWLSLDEADNEPGRFFSYFVAALRQGEESFCSEMFAALQAGQTPGIEALVTILVNAMLDWDALHVLALDDFHHIQDRTILDALADILAHGAGNLHLVLVTREDPPLPLARLRARGQLTEIRAKDLRFSEAEAARLLRDGLQLELSAADVTCLTERTEGWAAGLQLAGLSLQGRENPGAFVQTLSGSHRFILDFLTEEALKTQPPDVQDFLLKTSILPRLCGDLCDAVTGHKDSATLLERLLAGNLFIIPLDDEGRWYRYHHLFAELLQHRLRRECAACLPELHQRASRWHEVQEMPAASIEHALAGGDEARAAALIGKFGWRLLTQGHSRALQKWAQALPEALRNGSPKLNTVIVWGKILHGDYLQAGPYLSAAQSALEDLPPNDTDTLTLKADILALQSFMAQTEGKVPEALTLAEKARALAPDQDVRLVASTALAFGVACRMAGRFDEAADLLEEAIRAAHSIDDHITAMVAVAHLALLWYPLGRLRRLAEKAEYAIERAEAISRIAPFMIGSVHAVLGMVYYEWNQVEKARESLLHGIRLASLASQPASLIYGKVSMARLCLGEGDPESAARYLKEAGEVLAQGGPGWARLDWVGQQVSLLVAQGNLAEAEAILGTTGIPAESPVTYRTDVVHLAWLRLMIAGRHPGAFSLAGRIVQSAEVGRRNGTLIQALVLGAKAGGRQDWLERARQLAAPEGYQRVFIDDAFDAKAVAAQDLIAPLTERELEVLRLLAGGLTYAQMAERLVVSVNTVRYHVKGMYGKLGVEKQTQAVERGRELGLI